MDMSSLNQEQMKQMLGASHLLSDDAMHKIFRITKMVSMERKLRQMVEALERETRILLRAPSCRVFVVTVRQTDFDLGFEDADSDTHSQPQSVHAA